MKRLQFLLVLTTFFLCSITMSAQTVPDQMLLHTVNNELEQFAKENGYILNRDATYLSFPKSNLLVPTNTLGIISTVGVVGVAAAAFVGAAAIGATATIGGTAVGAAFGGAAVGAAVGVVGATAVTAGAAVGIAVDAAVAGPAAVAAVAAGAAGAAAVAAGAAAVATGAAGVDEGHFINHVHFVNHFRTELHYSLLNPYSLLDPYTNQTINGSCIFFFSVDDENGSVSYEIDNCTHDEIFPQNEKGRLRIGEDGPDFWDWTQKNVVVTDTFEIN